MRARAIVVAWLIVALAVASQAPRRTNAQERENGPARLAAVVGEWRPVESRVLGLLPHAAVGDRTPHPPLEALAGVAADLEREALVRPSPDAVRTLAALRVLHGRPDAAVRLILDYAPDTRDAGLLSTLAAAHLEQGRARQDPPQAVRAIEAADQAVAADAALPEAWFNRALALEHLGLVGEASESWREFLMRDDASGWADEARAHLARLELARPASDGLGELRDVVARGDGEAASKLATQYPHAARRLALEELTVAWADAWLRDDRPAAGAALRGLDWLGKGLAERHGDACVHDLAASLSASAEDPDANRRLAEGLRSYHEGSLAFRRDDFGRASDALARARDTLVSGGLPVAHMAAYQFACIRYYEGDHASALDSLVTLASHLRGRSYRHLRGQVLRTAGLQLNLLGRSAEALRHYAEALSELEGTGDPEAAAAIHSLIDELFTGLGEYAEAWRARHRALAALPELRGTTRAHVILDQAGRALLKEGHPRAALHVYSESARDAPSTGDPVLTAMALVGRSQAWHALGTSGPADDDLRAARREVELVSAPLLRERTTIELDLAEGRLLAGRLPNEAVAALDRAVAHMERTGGRNRQPEALLVRARAQLAAGRVAEAADSLEKALDEAEARRVRLGAPALRQSYSLEARAAFGAMVAFQASVRKDPRAAFAYAERERGRLLAEARASGAPRDADPSRPARDPLVLQRNAPARTTFVSYWLQPEGLLAWVLSRSSFRMAQLDVRPADIERQLARLDDALERRTPASVAAPLTDLYDALIRPLGLERNAAARIVFVPDGALYRVPFAALFDSATRRHLVQDSAVTLAPALGPFLSEPRARGAARPEADGDVLVVGDPRFDRTLFPSLPDLPGAAEEARRIAALYSRRTLVTGGEATIERFLGGARGARIVHFAGHARAFPAGARPSLLLLAPQPGRDAGVLRADEIPQGQFEGVALVVLSACRSGLGRVAGSEGPASLARALLAAGAENVVASLWDVDDGAATDLMLAFHGALKAGREPADALRAAQLASLAQAGQARRTPAAWAGFQLVSLPAGARQPRKET